MLKSNFLNPRTGEILSMDQAKQRDIENYVLSLDNVQKSKLLTEINLHRRIFQKFEKYIKEWILQNGGVTFDEGVGYFESWKIQDVVSYRFSEKELLEKGTEEEKKQYADLRAKYTKPVHTFRF